MSDSIFISIASYRDPQLVPTIEDAMRNATNPGQLVFGICMQDTKEQLAAFKYANHPQFRIIPVPYQESGGCCWARSKVQSLYKGETYVLQLDSHHRFINNWDTLLIEYLKQCPSEKPILTTYVTAYDPDNNKEKIFNDKVPYAMTANKFRDNSYHVMCVPRFVTEYLSLSSPQPTAFFSAHFVFTYGRWMSEVPYDPYIYFDSEETSLAVRSWTSGWDLYYPHRTVVYHEYTRKGRPKHWDDHSKWYEKDQSAMERFKTLVTGTVQQRRSVLGKYDLGTQRTIEQYQQFSGVNYLAKTLTNDAKQGIAKLELNATSGSSRQLLQHSSSDIIHRQTSSLPLLQQSFKWISHDTHTVFQKSTGGAGSNMLWQEWHIDPATRQTSLFSSFIEEDSHEPHVIVLYDKSRNLRIKLEASLASFKMNDDWNILARGSFQ